MIKQIQIDANYKLSPVIILGMPPIALGIHVTEIKTVLQSEDDTGQNAWILQVTKVSPRTGDS